VDQATSYLIFVHLDPIPEDADAVTLERALVTLSETLLPDYNVSVTAAWITNFTMISLEDLDNLPTLPSST
jgi:hypothetical protein